MRPTAAPLKLVSVSTLWASCRIFSVIGNPILFDTLDNLQSKLRVFLGAGRAGRKSENSFFVSRALFEPHVLSDAGLEKDGPENGANLFVGITRNVGAAIVQC